MKKCKTKHLILSFLTITALLSCTACDNTSDTDNALTPAPSGADSSSAASGNADQETTSSDTVTPTVTEIPASITPEGELSMNSESDIKRLAACFDGLALSETLKDPYYTNPVMTQRFGADPYALVYDGRVYLYMTGDVPEYNSDGTVKDNSYGKINTICVLSSADLVNWTDHGTIYAAGREGSATWANNSWAPAAACKEIDGKMKFFLYFANSAGGIGVLTADSPTGPFVDPIKKALISRSTPTCDTVTWLFDPAVLIDDDGRAYLYFGGGIPDGAQANPKTARVVELGADMISLAGDPVVIEPPYLFEDSGINKIGDTYYYSYCTNWQVDSEGAAAYGIGNAHVAYMTSDSPMGPFTFQGSILKNPGQFFGCYGNNHHCIFEFQDKYYIAYHTQILEKPMGISGGYRSTHIDEVTINPDGSIAAITATKIGPDALTTLNPFEKIEAETMHTMGGINTTQYGMQSTYYGSGNMVLCDIESGDWTMLSNVDFGTKATSFTASVHADPDAYGIIRISLDNTFGEVVGYLEVTPDGTKEYRELTCDLLTEVSGTHELYFTYYGTDYTIDYWYFR
ncbi:MAG: family 43 glycosylhydrolase [Lachnospiraceae bacterium]|nr:family 43 glycosylhydrolase [Lachnospiraceae bacterium]